jgi:hypothetical protein
LKRPDLFQNSVLLIEQFGTVESRNANRIQEQDVKIQASQDLGAGLMFSGFGAVFVIGAFNYSVGTSDQMGPGFMPLCAGLFISVIGLGLIGRSLFRGSERVALYPIPLGILCAAICVFALSFEPFGLIPAVVVLAALSARASSDFSVVTALLTAIVTAVLAAALFIWGLGLPFNAWPIYRL